MCLHDMLDIPEEIKKYINDYRLNIIQIKDNNLQLHNEKNKDLFKIMSIIYDIKKSKEERREELRKYEERRKISESVVDVVVATTNTKIKVTVRGRFMRNRINRIITYRIPEQASISEADFHRLATRICEDTEQIQIKYNKEGERKVCTLWDEVRQEGRQEGKAWAQYEAIENLMDSLNLSVEEAMEALKIPESDREQITQKLAQKFV